MSNSLKNAPIRVSGGEVLSLRGIRGALLECSEGALWLTVQGQPGDFLLTAGKQLRITSTGLVVIEGLPSGSIRQIRRSAWPLRWTSRLVCALSFKRPGLLSPMR